MQRARVGVGFVVVRERISRQTLRGISVDPSAIGTGSTAGTVFNPAVVGPEMHKLAPGSKIF